MNYTKIYENLIHRAINRTLDGYKEIHHIIPRCMGGTDTANNLVELTPEEHYIAHLLLTKIYPNNNFLIHAAIMMTVNGKNHYRKNKIYGWLRKKHSAAISKNQSGEGNSQFGRYWICNITTGEILRTTSSEIPIGWVRGKTGFTKCEVCGKNSGSKQRKFCSACRPKKIPPKTTMAKGNSTALKLSAHCKARIKEKHPQFGKRWVNNGEIQKMIPKDQLNAFLNNEWVRGKLPRQRTAVDH